MARDGGAHGQEHVHRRQRQRAHRSHAKRNRRALRPTVVRGGARHAFGWAGSTARLVRIDEALRSAHEAVVVEGQHQRAPDMRLSGIIDWASQLCP